MGMSVVANAFFGICFEQDTELPWLKKEFRYDFNRWKDLLEIDATTITVGCHGDNMDNQCSFLAIKNTLTKAYWGEPAEIVENFDRENATIILKKFCEAANIPWQESEVKWWLTTMFYE